MLGVRPKLPRASMGSAMPVPSGMFWSAIATTTNKPRPASFRRIGGTDREALGQAVDEQDREDQRGRPAAGAHAHPGADYRAGREQEHDSCEHASDHFGRRAAVEGGQKEADDGSDRHRPGGKAGQPRAPAHRVRPERPDGNHAKRGGDGGQGGDRENLEHRGIVPAARPGPLRGEYLGSRGPTTDPLTPGASDPLAMGERSHLPATRAGQHPI